MASLLDRLTPPAAQQTVLLEPACGTFGSSPGCSYLPSGIRGLQSLGVWCSC
ncbi:hypothetical protein [Paenibacillus catalpae]|uniref:hypothetical protein n=1 Tax=Paenibacillus catalpae TaxID=1045775 RepID=UPI001587C25F|nr:hypothetical protein [Paenibacillus catalpae]